MVLDSDPYLDYWSIMLGLPVSDLQRSDLQVSTAGRYVNRMGKDRFFLWRNLEQGKTVLAATKENLERVPSNARLDDEAVLEEFLSSNGFSEEFDDFDYRLPREPETAASRRNDPALTKLTRAHATEIAEFLSKCSDDEVDTLDLDLDTDAALGYFRSGALAGMGRTSQIAGTRLADITVLVGANYRNMGIAKSIVSTLVSRLDSREAWGKYRVSTNNYASQRVAEANGFVRAFRTRVWVETNTTDTAKK